MSAKKAEVWRYGQNGLSSIMIGRWRIVFPWKVPRKERKTKGPNVLERQPSASFLICSEHHPETKSDCPGLSIGDTAWKLGETWSEPAAKDKQPHGQTVDIEEVLGKVLLHTCQGQRWSRNEKALAVKRRRKLKTMSKMRMENKWLSCVCVCVCLPWVQAIVLLRTWKLKSSSTLASI